MVLAFRSSTSTSVTQLPVSTPGWFGLAVKDKCKAASLGDVVVTTLSVGMLERRETPCFKMAHFKHHYLLFFPQHIRPSFAPTSSNRPTEHIRYPAKRLAHLQLHFRIPTDDFGKNILWGLPSPPAQKINEGQDQRSLAFRRIFMQGHRVRI
jgi:hypothetical protein